MIKWNVPKEQIDKNFTLQELKAFSEKHNAIVHVPGVLTLTKGVVSWIQ